MKYIFFLFVLMAGESEAGQGKMLSIARDSYLTSSINALKDYCKTNCPDIPSDENYLYVCKMQLRADCSHGEDENKKNACDVLKRVNKLEKMVIVSDRNLSQVEKIPVGINLSIPKINDLPKIPSLPVAGEWIKTSIPNIQRMSEEEWVYRGRPNKKTFQELANEWRLARDKVNAQKIQTECKQDSNCKLEPYGSFGCNNGHEGFIAINDQNQSPDFVSALANYNQVQPRIYKEMKESHACAAVVRTFSAKCQENKCRMDIRY